MVSQPTRSQSKLSLTLKYHIYLCILASVLLYQTFPLDNGYLIYQSDTILFPSGKAKSAAISSWLLLEKVFVIQLDEKFSAFYGTQRIMFMEPATGNYSKQDESWPHRDKRWQPRIIISIIRFMVFIFWYIYLFIFSEFSCTLTSSVFWFMIVFRFTFIVYNIFSCF
jgi:hypothetical protein